MSIWLYGQLANLEKMLNEVYRCNRSGPQARKDHRQFMYVCMYDYARLYRYIYFSSSPSPSPSALVCFFLFFLSSLSFLVTSSFSSSSSSSLSVLTSSDLYQTGGCVISAGPAGSSAIVKWNAATNVFAGVKLRKGQR